MTIEERARIELYKMLKEENREEISEYTNLMNVAVCKIGEEISEKYEGSKRNEIFFGALLCMTAALITNSIDGTEKIKKGTAKEIMSHIVDMIKVDMVEKQ